MKCATQIRCHEVVASCGVTRGRRRFGRCCSHASWGALPLRVDLSSVFSTAPVSKQTFVVELDCTCFCYGSGAETICIHDCWSICCASMWFAYLWVDFSWTSVPTDFGEHRRLARPAWVRRCRYRCPKTCLDQRARQRKLDPNTLEPTWIR